MQMECPIFKLLLDKSLDRGRTFTFSSNHPSLPLRIHCSPVFVLSCFFFALHSVCNFETFFADLVDLCLALCVCFFLNSLLRSDSLSLSVTSPPNSRIEKCTRQAALRRIYWGAVCDCQRIYLRFSPSLTRINLNSTLLHGALALPM